MIHKEITTASDYISDEIMTLKENDENLYITYKDKENKTFFLQANFVSKAYSNPSLKIELTDKLYDFKEKEKFKIVLNIPWGSIKEGNNHDIHLCPNCNKVDTAILDDVIFVHDEIAINWECTNCGHSWALITTFLYVVNHG